ncbi:alpha/beta hydrolase [Georgenia sp. EYE_87]|uniref:alpha/beta fold hydrolase n=1 Tax=Georgenia sp. EYE_87 TaxID=2853448 RepID=UPI002004ACBC|nr:alpha/beta hydrolase [Georgenia sp. EYE_87]MCK6210093.1 alpha/beta hydrolase [Georgenia sp. EYE_87]
MSKSRRHFKIEVDDGVVLHGVRMGHGYPVVLLHGFPQDLHEWDQVSPLLQDEYELIAFDLKGSGGSSKTAAGYDKKRLAAEIDAACHQLGLDQVAVIGHDIGGMIAYSWAAFYPERVSRIAVIDVPIPGVSFWDDALRDPLLWHFAFHMKENLPEALLEGKEALYVHEFVRERAVNLDAFENGLLDTYTQNFAAPGTKHGMLGWYRAFPDDAEDNRGRLELGKLTLPVLAVGGRARWGSQMESIMREFALDVTGAVIEDCGHWVPEEQPEELARVLKAFLSEPDGRGSEAALTVSGAASVSR